jgi:hypothetical protein
MTEYPAASAVWEILVDECGAWNSDDSALRDFERHWPDCREYRFQGRLGFGGKVWANVGQVYVTCYREDETPERAAMITRANVRLEALTRIGT